MAITIYGLEYMELFMVLGLKKAIIYGKPAIYGTLILTNNLKV